MSDWFNHVTAATTAMDGPAGNGNIPTSAPGITSIDGVALEPGNRILLKNQTKPSENGKTEWSLRYTSLNGKTNYFWTKAWASTADAIYYVSTSAYADDAFDGLSHGTAH